MSNKQNIQETLVAMGFQKNYIDRAFKVYEKNFYHRYNIETITEMIRRLRNKDRAKKQKRDAENKHIKSQPQSSQYKPSRPSPSAPPRFKPKEIVLYNGGEAEIQRIRQDGLIEITY
eukprot:507973_1